MKIWVKYGNEEARIDLGGCEFVAQVKDKIHEEFKNKMKDIDASDLILKWKNEELKAGDELNDVQDLKLATNKRDPNFQFLIVQLRDSTMK